MKFFYVYRCHNSTRYMYMYVYIYISQCCNIFKNAPNFLFQLAADRCRVPLAANQLSRELAVQNARVSQTSPPVW